MARSRLLCSNGRIFAILLIGLACCSCQDPKQDAVSDADSQQPKVEAPLDNSAATRQEQPFFEPRAKMVASQMESRGISNTRVLGAMRKVPRHRFVPIEHQSAAYADRPLPIGQGQTISQPYIVALTTQLVDPKPNFKALDVGTGSGYQAAVLAELVKSVYSIEIVESLANEARRRLKDLGYKNVEVRAGDGYRGWPEQAPFDIITVAAAPDHVPQPLVDQLAPGGRMVIPVGSYYQTLLLIKKDDQGKVTRRNVSPVAFVPMTGEAQE